MGGIDPRGPVPQPGAVPVLRPTGFEVPGFSFQPPTDTLPNAVWIGCAVNVPVFLARKSFQLGGVPKRAPLLISADKSYRIWVNGRLLARGPDDIGMDYHRVQNDRWLVDVRDAAPLLRRGTNTLAVEVFADSLIGWEGSRGRGGLLVELRAGATVVRSDRTWLAVPATHWDKSRGHWTFDPSSEPAGWRDPETAIPSWPPAVELPDRWQPRLLSEIPQRAEITFPAKTPTRFPLEIRAGSPRIVLKYPRVLPAYLGLEVSGGAGGTLWIEPNEPDAPGYNRRFAVRLNGTGTVVEAPYMDSFSVVNFRLEGTSETAVIHDVRANAVSQPVEYRGTFESSDRKLNDLWSACRWATQICLQAHHLDSPHHQEPISDPGDYLIASLLNYGTFFQPWLTRQDARKYAGILRVCKNQVFHTSYALLWLRMVVDYTLYTGDLSLERELSPEIHALIETFLGYRGNDGLISEAPNYMFLDWVDIAGFPGHHPPAAIGMGYMTTFVVAGLADAAGVAERTGDTAKARRYRTLRARMIDDLHRELWMPEKGRYRDGFAFRTSVKPGQWLPADSAVETSTAHVNILAVLHGIAPADQRRAILEKALDGPEFTCQPYFMHFVFDALAQNGLFEERAPGLLKRWNVVEQTQSLREMWDRGDLSHSWGATPLHQCQARILGVVPTMPGFTEVSIVPHRCGLRSAKGRVPCPQGTIGVQWRVNTKSIETTVEIPAGVRAAVQPLGGEPVHTVGAGVHRFERPRVGNGTATSVNRSSRP